MSAVVATSGDHELAVDMPVQANGPWLRGRCNTTRNHSGARLVARILGLATARDAWRPAALTGQFAAEPDQHRVLHEDRSS